MRHKITRERIANIGFKQVDAFTLAPAARNIFLRNKQAVELKLDGYTSAEILKVTGVPASELSRYFKRYTTINEEGVFWGGFFNTIQSHRPVQPQDPTTRKA